MENIYLKEYYENYDEDGRLLRRHSRLEFITTMKYVGKYLKDGDRILEIGAGTGRYSHALARLGYKVDAVELVGHNIEIFKANTKPGEDVTVTQGNALDLSAFADETYDITLLLGPMYHLYTEGEQKRALSEAVRVTKKGGVIFVAYCMADATIIQYCFLKGKLNKVIESGLLDPETFEISSRPEEVFELHTKAQIEKLRSYFDVTHLGFIATDGMANYIRDAIESMDEEMYEAYIKYHLATCERADLVGYSNHTLDIFRKGNGNQNA